MIIANKIKVKGVRADPTGQRSNKDIAKDIESARRTQLAKGEAGIEEKEVKIIPTLEEFKSTFMDWVRSEKRNEGTQIFYSTCYDRVCEFKELGRAKLDQIDEPAVERFKLESIKHVGKTTANRYLATLRKALRYACKKQKLIDKLPEITLYDKDSGAERECEYVYSATEYQEWLRLALEPLRSAAVLAHDSGICRGELLALEWDCVHLEPRSNQDGFWGTIEIRRGLKRSARKRTVPITEDMAAVLRKLREESHCAYVFTSSEDRTKKLSANTLANQHRIIKKKCAFHPDAGLHALRHTFLTEAGRHTQNVKALQRLAGHSRIETTMKYIHPDQRDQMEIARAVQEARSRRSAITKISDGVATVSATGKYQENVVASKLQ